MKKPINQRLILITALATIMIPCLSAAYTASEPLFNSQWGLAKIGMATAWDKNLGSANTIVAVLDTGVDYNHEDLSSQLWRDPGTSYFGYDFVNKDNDPMDDHKHGTMIAGIIAAAMNNKGVAGICPNCKIMAVKVMDSNGEGSPDNIASGIRYATDHGAKVINMSFGLQAPADVLEQAISYAHDRGVTLVAASGNKGNPSVEWPAASNYVISVGATNSQDALAVFSNYGAGLDMVAPGQQITTTSWSATNAANLYESASGTSFAAAHVSGMAALLISLDPSLKPDQVAKRIIGTTDKIGGVSQSGTSFQYGSGRLNASRVLSYDTFAPTITAQIAKAGADYILSGNATDDLNNPDTLNTVADSNIKSLYYQLDQNPTQTVISSPSASPYSFSFAIPSVKVGNHTITLNAQDTANNPVSKTISFTADTESSATPTPPVNLINGFHYKYVNQSPYLTLAPGAIADVWLDIQNTGTSSWDPNIVHLGTARSLDRASRFYDSATWLAPNRIKMEQTTTPGSTTRFSFKIKAPAASGNYKEYFRPVADGFSWMEDYGIFWSFTVSASDYRYQFINQSPYPVLSPGQTATLWLDLLNTGANTWDQNVVRLGTSSPLDRASSFYTASSWLASNRIKMSAASTPQNSIAHFEFTITAPQKTGVYREYFRPVADGVTWLPDAGIYWEVVVK